jgi:hypothetical protein
VFQVPFELVALQISHQTCISRQFEIHSLTCSKKKHWVFNFSWQHQEHIFYHNHRD